MLSEPTSHNLGFGSLYRQLRNTYKHLLYGVRRFTAAFVSSIFTPAQGGAGLPAQPWDTWKTPNTKH
jgi:hypothetical protein